MAECLAEEQVVPRASICYTYRITVRFEWDDAKNRKNVAKHGLSFEDAEQVLSGPCVTFEDDRFAYGEERLITLGVLAGRVIVIAIRRAMRERASSP